jgi:nucleotide-binding universal stress UspA family protein
MGPIIVPLDQSDLAEQALPWAALVARAQGRLVTLVSVRPPADAYWEFVDVDPRPSREAHHETLLNYLEQIRRSRHLAGLTVSVRVLDGDIVPQLEWLTDLARASLIVLTTRGRGGAAAGRVGSIADRLVRTAGVPVMVVPPEVPYAPVEAILTPLDGSVGATSVLAMARELAHHLPATIHLLHVVDPDLAWGLPEEEAADYLDVLKLRAQAYLGSVALAGELTSVAEGRTPDAILDYAGENGCRLVAMTSRGRAAEQRRELGSVAAAMLQMIDRPVLVLRVANGEP